MNRSKNQMRTEIALSRILAESESANAIPIVFNSGGPGARVSVPGSNYAEENPKIDERAIKLPSLAMKFSSLTKKIVDEESNPVDFSPAAGSESVKAAYINGIGTTYHRNLVQGERPTKSLLRVFYGHLGAVNSIDVLQLDEKEYLFSASVDKTCRMFDTSTTECLRVFEGHTGIVTSIVVTTLHGSYNKIKSSRALDYESEVAWGDEDSDLLEFKFNATSKNVIFRLVYR